MNRAWAKESCLATRRVEQRIFEANPAVADVLHQNFRRVDHRLLWSARLRSCRLGSHPEGESAEQTRPLREPGLPDLGLRTEQQR